MKVPMKIIMKIIMIVIPGMIMKIMIGLEIKMIMKLTKNKTYRRFIIIFIMKVPSYWYLKKKRIEYLSKKND